MAFTPEQKTAHRARQKALKALLAFDESQGKKTVYEWSQPEEVNTVVPLSAKERMRLSRARAKSVVAELPDMLKLLKPLPIEKVLDVVPIDDQQIPVFDSVICDWLTISHPLREFYPLVNDGQILRINKDGSNDWTTECWETLRCASSDTSLRIKCDGYKIMMTGNIGRFGHMDNLNGHTVSDCVEKWRGVVADYFPARTVKITNPTTGITELRHYKAVDLAYFFGSDIEMVNRSTGEIELMGTRITRCDLAGNFFTDNFASLTAMLMTRKLGQRPPRAGKFGPMWGYDSKRANWLKAKVYDKTCELEGRRTSASGATTARFEVQLGSEILKRRGLSVLDGWKGSNVENVIYAEFSNQVFREQATAESWLDIPPRIRQYAVLWRDGVPLRNQCKSDATFYRVRKQLLDYGVDASQPCNVMTLVRRVEVVKVMPLPARRSA